MRDDRIDIDILVKYPVVDASSKELRDMEHNIKKAIEDHRLSLSLYNFRRLLAKYREVIKELSFRGAFDL